MVNKLPWLVLIALVIIKLLWNGYSKPLVKVHWDSAVYLYLTKQFSETAFIKHHIQQVPSIAAQVVNWPYDERFLEIYWHFSRLGHIVLLGTIVKIFGSGEQAIVAAHWLYNILMALTMVSAVLLVTTLVNCLDRGHARQVVLWSALGSAVLYMISPIYAYMGRSLVSEVPAMLLLTVAILLLLKGLNRHSVFLSCCSGFFAFLSYSIRLESIWLYISFCAVLAVTLWIMHGRTQWLLAYAVAGSIAFACYLLYAWYFYPLANPDLFIPFAKHQLPWKGGVPFYRNISAAGGWLWIGVFASIIATFHWNSGWTTARMALAWAGAALLPSLPYLMQNLILIPPYRIQIQTRMLFIIFFLPLLVSSTLGWAYIWEYRKRCLHFFFFAIVSLTVLLIALSKWTLVARLSRLPTLPSYEQNTYRFDELNRFSQVIYSKNIPVFLVYDRNSISEEDVALMRFFGPAYPPQANLTLLNDPTNSVQCEECISAPPSLEKVSYCVDMTTHKLQQLTEQGITVFLLTSLSTNNHTIMPFGYTEVLRTQNYRLGIIESL
jgi:hypothetical protein